MKNLLIAAVLTASLYAQGLTAQEKPESLQVSIDLNNIVDDKVEVTTLLPAFKADQVIFHIPKTVPGTYSTDNYGKYVEGFKAFDSRGKELAVSKTDDNSWEISKAKKLAKITYLVNDTYDIESSHDIFSPAGTNIDAGKNFMLNMHGFVGYVQGKDQLPYEVSISHPAGLWGATSLTDLDASDTKDVFRYSRYFEVGDNPIMYSKPDYVTFMAGDMEILLAVYSPNGLITAAALKPDMERTMLAQKRFLGHVNATKKYAVLLYMSDMAKPDAHGFGALEHHTSTTVVFPEAMPVGQLLPALIDTVSHEFFHIVTPLTIHAEQIQFFDYADPKMSEHLWMYEGVTEYFANLFQVNQGLIPEDEFFDRMAQKMSNAARMNDTMPFTEMSANVLTEPYKAQYLNVYEKGTLIGMCIDIIIREKSNGKRGILDMMQKLSAEYGVDKPFKDADLFPKIVSITYPEVGEFLNTYVAGSTPIPYETFLAKVGVSKTKRQQAGNLFIKGTSPLLTVNRATKEIIMLSPGEDTAFMKSVGIKGGDIITSINGTAYNQDNILDMVMGSQDWAEDQDITLEIKRNNQPMTLKGKVKFPYEEVEGYRASDDSKKSLREAWLKG